MEQLSRKDFLINTLYFLTIAAGIYLFCRFLIFCLLPFVIAGVVALIVQKPADRLSSRIKLKSSFIAGLLAVSVFAAVTFIFVFLSLKLMGVIISFFTYITENIDLVYSLFENIKIKINSVLNDMPNSANKLLLGFYDNAAKMIISKITEFISSFAATTAKKAPSFLISLIVSAVASFYISADFKGLTKFAKSILGGRVYGNILKIKNILTSSVFKLVKGYFILMLITFIELTVGFLILKLKYPYVLAGLISLIDLLPVLGTGTVLVPWSIICFTLGNTRLGISILILYLIIILVRNFAEPKIIGGQIGINPLFTLLSMFIGIKLLGFAGVIVFPLIFIVTVKYYKEEK